jgi:glutamate-1-semialdehyde 2,1-aminomutase
MVSAPARSTLYRDYEERFAGSKAAFQRAGQAISGGMAHDGRYQKPFPLYVERAKGSHKWDVDGHDLIDYAIGHGALILGHLDPDVVAALEHQLKLGTHYGSSHLGEIVWAEQVQKLVPSAERVRFVGSGTEANLLAMRIARSFTGKNTIMKFEGHFHGWSDYLIKGEKPPFENATAPGVPDEVLRSVAVVPSNDLAAAEERLTQGDVAAIIIEPSGASWTTIPLAEGFLAKLRELATAYGAVLIFDEVITGFRWSPGGAQAKFGVIPDMTTMAKIVAGGLPGGAVAGKVEIMEQLLFKDDAGWNAKKKVVHPGTFNSNPLTAAAGAACLTKVADPAVQEYCDALAARARIGFNTVLEKHAIPGAAWGESSVFHLMVGTPVSNRVAGDMRVPEGVDAATLKSSGKAGANAPLALAMQLEGVDLFNGGGLLSTAHTDEDVDFTVEAFDRSLQRLRLDGFIE